MWKSIPITISVTFWDETDIILSWSQKLNVENFFLPEAFNHCDTICHWFCLINHLFWINRLFISFGSLTLRVLPSRCYFRCTMPKYTRTILFSLLVKTWRYQNIAILFTSARKKKNRKKTEPFHYDALKYDKYVMAA